MVIHYTLQQINLIYISVVLFIKCQASWWDWVMQRQLAVICICGLSCEAGGELLPHPPEKAGENPCRINWLEVVAWLPALQGGHSGSVAFSHFPIKQCGRAAHILVIPQLQKRWFAHLSASSKNQKIRTLSQAISWEPLMQEVWRYRYLPRIKRKLQIRAAGALPQGGAEEARNRTKYIWLDGRAEIFLKAATRGNKSLQVEGGGVLPCKRAF